ncbi:MAG: universal stress protein, partial [marine benthic group bacterium]|nr:universal stress protein [Gemmatimonadota bacterium]
MSLLVALDFTDVTDVQLLIVARLAAPNREIYLLHVAEPDPSFVGFDAGPDEVRDQVAREFHQEHERIQALADRLREAGFNAKALLVQGPTVSTILAEAEKVNAEAIVVGSHGHGKLYDFAVGSVSSEVIR